MEFETRWLIWDGFYTLFGSCNQPLAPITTISGVRARLRRLGFYRGDPARNDNTLDQELAEAIRDFKAFPNAPRPADTPEIDSKTRSALDALFKGPMAGKGAGKEGRSGEAKIASFAARVVSVPAQFNPFAELAGIEVQLNRSERAESMLLRIYRNYEQSADQGREIRKERLVYQEVLDSAAIRALSRRAVGDATKNRAPYSPQLAEIIRQKRRYTSGHVCEAQAPYKVRVWVSSFKDTFVAYADRANPAWRGLLPRFTAFEFARGEDQLDASDPQPAVDKNNIVHDQSNFAQGSDTQLWTGADVAGVNLFQIPCPLHDARFKADNAQQQEFFPLHFRDNPAEVYLELSARAAANPNFSFPDLGEVFENMGRHLNRVRQRLCCGEDSWVRQELKDEINAGADLLMAELSQLIRSGFPYRDSLRFCIKFIEMVDWIVFNTKTVAELEHYQLAGKADDGFPLNGKRQLDLLTQARARRDGLKYASQYVMQQSSRSLADIYNGKGCLWKTNEQIAGVLSTPDIVVLPSYNPLDEAFFIRIRQVPMFMLGLIDLEYLNADAHRYSPYEFFKHDLFHTFANPGETQRNPQLWHTMIARANAITGGRGFGSPQEQRQIVARWEAYGQHMRWLLDAAAAQGDKDFAEALGILLFCVFHEPIKSAGYPATFSPALLEPQSAAARLQDADLIAKIEDRARDFWFGPPNPAVIGKFRQAAQHVLANLEPWLELELVDEQGGPVPGEPFRLAFGDGTSVSGRLDANGRARLDRLGPGPYTLVFPRHDSAWFQPNPVIIPPPLELAPPPAELTPAQAVKEES